MSDAHTMTQIVCRRPGECHAERAAMPRPAPGEALVRVHRIGVCGTDLHAYRGRQPFFEYPRVLGHELGVAVEQAPAGQARVRVNDYCCVRPYLNDPNSPASLRGKSNCCQHVRGLGVHLDGGMCDYMTIPVGHLHPSNSLTLDQLALVEPMAIGCHAIERAALSAAEAVLVIGAGPIGLAAMQFALIDSGNVTVLDISAPRLAFCRQHWSVNAVAALDQRQRFDCVIDATGNPASMMGAFEYVDHGGRLVFVGLFQGDVTFHDPLFHAREMTLLASRNATAANFDRVIREMEAGRIIVEPMISCRMALIEVPQKFESLYKMPNLVKAMIDVHPSGA